jgi:hypothetical protein
VNHIGRITLHLMVAPSFTENIDVTYKLSERRGHEIEADALSDNISQPVINNGARRSFVNFGRKIASPAYSWP